MNAHELRKPALVKPLANRNAPVDALGAMLKS
jgi:hypothetical protein